MMRALLTGLALIVPAAAPGEQFRPTIQRESVPWVDPRPAPRGERLLISAMLDGHNSARASYGVAALSWDPALARSAMVYARRLAASGRFEHDPANRGPAPQGENLFMGTRAAYSYAEMVGGWVNERRHYRPGPVPTNSRTGDFSAVGHYTQIIWPTTQRVGCATASSRSHDYLVCRYWPAGNVVGTRLR
ncbi:CAP domain-containing protein [Sphingomonas xanthus]|nr:CAP domain-containing protein [Sphingomonas xanthus]